MLEKEKIDEIKSFIEFHDIDVVVTNDELTTAQSKTLNDNLGIKIIDRTQLILEIFALRAKVERESYKLNLHNSTICYQDYKVMVKVYLVLVVA